MLANFFDTCIRYLRPFIESKPESATGRLLWRNGRIEEASNTVLDRDIDRASAAALTIQEELGSARTKERRDPAFVTTPKTLQCFWGWMQQ